jgi:hypothetical protein
LTVEGLQGHTAYEILDMQGRMYLKGKIENEPVIGIRDLVDGSYLLRFDTSVIHFIKN